MIGWLDKNVGECFVTCPVTYEKTLDALFDTSNGNYTRVYPLKDTAYKRKKHGAEELLKNMTTEDRSAVARGWQRHVRRIRVQSVLSPFLQAVALAMHRRVVAGREKRATRFVAPPARGVAAHARAAATAAAAGGGTRRSARSSVGTPHPWIRAPQSIKRVKRFAANSVSGTSFTARQLRETNFTSWHT